MQDNHANPIVRFHLVEGLLKFRDHLGVDSVELFGAIQCQQRDRAASLIKYSFHLVVFSCAGKDIPSARSQMLSVNASMAN